MGIDKCCGRMEESADIAKVLRQLADEYDKGKRFMPLKDLHWGSRRRPANCNEPGIAAKFVPESKHHNGKPMMLICNIADCPTICLEISEEGVFAYYVDDGVS